MPASKRSPQRSLVSPPAGNSGAYQTLLKSIQTDITDSLDRAKRQADRMRVELYWLMGQRIYAFQQTAEHKDKVVSSLAGDLKLDVRIVHSIVQFYTTYRRLPAQSDLNWSHYRYLIQIPDADQRKAWQQRIVREGLSAKKFFLLLSQEKKQNQLAELERPDDPRPGLLYHYRIISAPSVADASSLLRLDLGFDVRIDVPFTQAVLDASRIVMSVRGASGYEVRLSKATKDALYTYQARIERVVDGDTLIVELDLGFGVCVRQRLRLKNIDAPEMSTVAGQRARQRVIDILRDCQVLMVRTRKSDMYDRYLADIWYTPGETDTTRMLEQGRYLNAQLLEEGVVEVYRQ